MSNTTSEAAGWSAVPVLAERLGIEWLVNVDYYEIRLGAVPQQVDYLAAVSRAGASPLLQQLAKQEREGGSGSDARWSSLLRLIRRWADGSSGLSVRVPTLWLEFDRFELAAPSRTTPSVSVCLVPGYRSDRPLDPLTAKYAPETVRELMEVTGVESPELQMRLSECFAKLPSAGRFIHASIMLGREPCALKLYGTLPRRELLAYLRAIDWSGDYSAIARALEGPYAPELSGDQLFVDLNLSNLRNAEACTLGLALSQQHVAASAERDTTRSRALTAWIDAGFCTAAQSDQLREWLDRGVDAESRAASATRNDRFLDLKLVWQAKTGFLAKAYLGTFRSRRFFSSEDGARLA